MSLKENESKIYLGDGAYACWDGSRLVLTTSDGIRDTNTIYLDMEVLDVLIQWLYNLHRAGEFDDTGALDWPEDGNDANGYW